MIVSGGVGSAVGKMATRFTTAGGSESARKVGNKMKTSQMLMLNSGGLHRVGFYIS